MFHSFRHCFVTAIRGRRGTDELLIDQIVGHDEYNSVRHTYTGELLLPQKAEAVANIDYKIDLSHIRSWAGPDDVPAARAAPPLVGSP